MKVDDKDFIATETEIEVYEPMEEVKSPRDFEYGGVFIRNDINEKK